MSSIAASVSHHLLTAGVLALFIACCLIQPWQISKSNNARSAASLFINSFSQAEDKLQQQEAELRMAGKLRMAALRAVILGAPGSGKGTISARIVEQFDVSHLSSGDKLRQHVVNQTALGKEVKNYLDSGSLVPDDTMIALISEEIKALADRNWLLDGFPRTVAQAKMLDSQHSISLAIQLIVPEYEIIRRVKDRWVHLPSGRVYNIGFNDPKVPGKDDVTGEPLCQRSDDRPNVVQHRLNEHVKNAKPVMDYYEKRGILRQFTGVTTDELWPGIKDCVLQTLRR